jgi:HSP20 family molecular chaperone IbpA
MKSNGYDPPYNCFILNNKLIIRIECPGNHSVKPDYKYSGEYTIITIKGNKKKDKEPEKIEDNIYNTREFGNFCINIPFKTEVIKIKNQKPKRNYEKGVLFLEYEFEEIVNNYSFNDSNIDDEI